MDNFDNLLSGIHTLEQILAHAFGADIVHKGFDNGEIDICFQQRQTHFPESGLNIFFSQAAMATQACKNTAQSVR